MQAIEPFRTSPAGRSPGLDQFRKNPFRVLQLAPSATTQQAIWQGEKVLARVRAGVALESDLAPWLAPGTELEILDAMQTIESPLARLVEQLLWFDFDGDPRGAALRHALIASDSATLHDYVMAADDGPLAARLNQVNLRLLIGFSELRGVGPQVLPPRKLKAPVVRWRVDGGLAIIEDPHAMLRAGRAADGAWVELIANAVLAWGRLLKDPEVIEELRGRLTTFEQIEEERVSADDVEAVTKAVWTRLADLVIAEARLELQSGIVENAARFIEFAKNSEIDTAIWLVTAKPLRAQFQLELAALDARPTAGGTLADLQSYLDRLGALLARWKPLDANGLLGLATPIDEAVDDVFGRLRACDLKERRRGEFDSEINRISELAVSHSLRQRIASYRKELEDDVCSAEALVTLTCHFCRRREGTPADAAAIIVRTSDSGYFQRRALPVARCAWCAQLHHRILRISYVMRLCYWAALGLCVIAMPMSTTGRVEALLVAPLCPIIADQVTRIFLGSNVTPAGHRRFWDHWESEAITAMRRTSGWASDIVYDETPGAWQRLEGGFFDSIDGRPFLCALASVVGRPLACGLSILLEAASPTMIFYLLLIGLLIVAVLRTG